MENKIKVSLALLLLICLINMPYGYYQLVRFLAMIGFGILAYRTCSKGHLNVAIIYTALAVLFQPIIKIAFSRYLWNMIDVLVAIGLILSIYRKTKNLPR
ncbi:DUF6804 family protein [uncultured Pedobacter sp.]|uniref:DUF6804 family protein n=1 Tax=uncultured Pedobacter sp. TaxID=246139 RepID=UPI0025F3928E|nr:DUF6804 family protein [uncultured Pedobacter sp.]